VSAQVTIMPRDDVSIPDPGLPTSRAPIEHRGFRLHSSLLSTPPPTFINLELTNYCNLRCTHCGHSQYPEFVKGHADSSLFERLLPLLGPGKIRFLGVTSFGETLMSPQWWSTFSRALAIPDVILHLVTNGLLLDRHLDQVAHPRVDVVVSMDGASEDTYAHFRGPGHFHKVLANLRVLRERELAGTLPPTRRAINMTVSRINVHEMPKLVELAAELGMSSVTLFFQIFHDEAAFRRESLYFEPKTFDRWLRTAREAAARRSITLLHPDSFDGSMGMPPLLKRGWLWRDDQSRVRCGFVDDQSYISWHGQVEACRVQDRHTVGNLHEDAFVDIWWGPIYRRLRQSFLRGQKPLVCENCNMVQSLDVHEVQSHFVKPIRDDGRLHSCPQPYRITVLEPEFQGVVRQLSAGESPERLLPPLHRMRTHHPELHEVSNAIGVLWTVLGHPDQAMRALEDAAAIAPDDDLVRDNVSRIRGSRRTLEVIRT
jgi:MoaA/NifB/PqqE/SkfB family radical SAM enzyme